MKTLFLQFLSKTNVQCYYVTDRRLDWRKLILRETMYWFLYDKGLHHKGVKLLSQKLGICLALSPRMVFKNQVVCAGEKQVRWKENKDNTYFSIYHIIYNRDLKGQLPWLHTIFDKIQCRTTLFSLGKEWKFLIFLVVLT